MEKDKIVSVYIHSPEITSEQLNSIVNFVVMFNYYTPNQIEIICDYLPLRLNGKISNLSIIAEKYFHAWNKDSLIRNIRLVKKGEEHAG